MADAPARPLARLIDELRLTGIGQMALGLACLAAALTGSDLEVIRAVVPFAVAAAAVGGLSIYASRWMRTAPAPRIGVEAELENPAATTRRCLIALSIVLLAVAIASLLGPGLAVVLGGVVAAAGVVDLANRNVVRTRERSEGIEIFRETGLSPFSSGRRPLYTRPMRASTLAT